MPDTASVTYRTTYWTDEEFPRVALSAFELLRRTRRYSAATMMALRTLADRTPNDVRAEMDREMSNPATKAYVTAATAPFSIDPETEVKTGGLVGVAVTLYNDEGNGRTLLGVSPSWRRHYIGTHLLYRHGLSDSSLWVSETNQAGLAFLSAYGFAPVSLRDGMVEWRYSNLAYPSDVGERETFESSLTRARLVSP